MFFADGNHGEREMKIALVSNRDTVGGDARAAYRLHQGFRSIGLDSKMLVQLKFGDDESVIGPKSGLPRYQEILRTHLDQLVCRFYPGRSKTIGFSPAIFTGGMPKSVLKLSPDIIHLHRITGGFFRIESLKKIKAPLVWTLHDSWSFTGGCDCTGDCLRYQQSCGKCPILGSDREFDLSRWIWKRKQKAWEGINLTVVTPSAWLKKRGSQSSLFKRRRIEVIPNGIDVHRFYPVKKEMARKLLGLPAEKKLILFTAMKLNDPHKGGRYLLEASRALSNAASDQPELVFLGSSTMRNDALPLKANYLGRLQDDASLALVYSAADLLVAPYTEDNFPNVVLEAMACGTPVVGFDAGGIPEIVEHQKTGYLAKSEDVSDLVHGITWTLDDFKRWQSLSKAARKKVEDEFEIKKIANRYLTLFEELLRA